jgi:hypothetical protein
MDDDVLVLPLDMLKFDLHKPAVEEVLSRFKQVLHWYLSLVQI